MTLAQVLPGERSPLPQERYVRAPDLLWRTIPGVAVVLLREVGQDVVLLSGSGLALWHELEQPCALDEVAVRFAARYGVTPDTVLAGLGAALSDLEDKGLVRRHGD